MSKSEMTWTSGLIPMIEPESASEIISRIADLALVISGSGLVLGVLSNPNSQLNYAFSRWEGQPLAAHLTVESVPKFEERLAAFIEQGKGTVRPVELNHAASDQQQEFPVRYSFHRIGTEGAILLLGQDLRPVAEMQQQLVSAQIALEKDYEAQREYDTRLRVLMGATSDGVLFASLASGDVTDCNASLLSMLGMGRGELVGRSLTDLITLADGKPLIEGLMQAAETQAGSEISVQTAKGQVHVVRPTVFAPRASRCYSASL